MLPSLTCRLLLASSDAWRQLTDADTHGALPSPALHGAALGGIAATSAALCSFLRPHIDFGNTVRCTVAALSGGLGATALALVVVPTLLQRPVSPSPVNTARAARYASAATLPLAASGCITALPSLTASYIALALFCALAYRSGSLGARVLLGLSGSRGRLVAASTTLVATLPSLVAASLLSLH